MQIPNNRIILFLTLSIVVGVLSCVKIYSFDYWTHLYIGQQFCLENADSLVSSLLNVGSGLYSKFFPVLLYSISNVFGDSFISIFVALVFALTFACYLFMAAKMDNDQLLVYLLAIGLMLFFARIRMVPRPEVIAYLLQAVVMWLIMSTGEKLSKIRLISLILLFLFWRTVHVSWIFGLFFVALYQYSERRADFILLCGLFRRKALLVLILSGMIFTLFLFRRIIITFLDNFEKLMQINEMQPLWVFPEYFLQYSVVFILLIALNFLITPPVFRRVVVLFVLYGLGALIARNSVFFLFAAIPFTVKTCSEISWQNNYVKVIVRYVSATVMVALVVLIVLDKDPEMGIGINEKFFPIQSTEYISKNLDQPVVFNDLDWGGYLLWRSAGKITPFVDGRLGAKTSKFDDYGNIINAQSPGILLSQYGINTILTRWLYLNSGRIYPLLFFLNFNNEWHLLNAKDGLVFSTTVLPGSVVIDKKIIWESLLMQIDHIDSLDGRIPHLLYSKGVALYMLGEAEHSRNVFLRAFNDSPELKDNYAMFLQGVGL